MSQTDSGRPDQSAPTADRDGETTATVDQYRTGRETVVVAYDHDGDRYCPECAAEHDDIDRDRYFYDEPAVRAGGAVTLGMARMAGPDAIKGCGGCFRVIEAFQRGGGA